MKNIQVYIFKDEIFENMYPAILPNEIYTKVRNKIGLNKYGKLCYQRNTSL